MRVGLLHASTVEKTVIHLREDVPATLLTGHLGVLVEKGPHVTGNTGTKPALNIPRSNERRGFRMEKGLGYTKPGHGSEADNWGLVILTPHTVFSPAFLGHVTLA